MRKKALESVLSRLDGLEHPKLTLEQYLTPWETAAAVVLRVAEDCGLQGKVVLDLGAGAGMLALGCLAAGAARVLCVEIDPAAVEALRANAVNSPFAERVEIIAADVCTLQMRPLAVA